MKAKNNLISYLTVEKLDSLNIGEKYEIEQDKGNIYYCFNINKEFIQLISYDEKKDLGIMGFINRKRSKLLKKIVGDRDIFEIFPVENVKTLKKIISKLGAQLKWKQKKEIFVFISIGN